MTMVRLVWARALMIFLGGSGLALIDDYILLRTGFAAVGGLLGHRCSPIVD